MGLLTRTALRSVRLRKHDARSASAISLDSRICVSARITPLARRAERLTWQLAICLTGGRQSHYIAVCVLGRSTAARGAFAYSAFFFARFEISRVYDRSRVALSVDANDGRQAAPTEDQDRRASSHIS